MTRAALLLAVAALLAGCGHQVPAGQPPLAAMNLDALRADFNRAADRPRLVLLMSPT